MTSLFDGMSGLLVGGLGTSGMTYCPKAAAERPATGLFRAAPTEAVDPDGHGVLIVAPTWRVPRDTVPEIQRGDVLRLASGRSYTILNHHPSGSPADDGFLICELERIYP